MNNMNNKVSEKAIWEGSITPDEPPITASQIPQQPQMMFCYKCNQVIPSNSTYCPYCQVKLFTECPKCGAKYSSQYPSCSQCGTNRQEYLREEIIRQEKLKRKRQNKKRYERLRKQKEEKAKEAYIAENAKIMETREYKSLHSLLLKPVKTYIIYNKIKELFIVTSTIVSFIACFIVFLYAEDSTPTNFGDIISLILGAFMVALAISSLILIACEVCMGDSEEKRIKFLSKYISSKNVPDNDMLQYVLKRLSKPDATDDMLNYLSQWCIEAYRTKNGLPILDI